MVSCRAVSSAFCTSCWVKPAGTTYFAGSGFGDRGGLLQIDEVDVVVGRRVGRVLLQPDRVAGRDGGPEQHVGLVVDVPRGAGAGRVARAGLVAVQPLVLRGEADRLQQGAVDVDVQGRGVGAVRDVEAGHQRVGAGAGGELHGGAVGGQVHGLAAGRLTGGVADGAVRRRGPSRRRRARRPPPRRCRTACWRRGPRRRTGCWCCWPA